MMPTFDAPIADAAEAYKGLRGLAHATRTFENPADTYRVLDEVADRVMRAHEASGRIAWHTNSSPEPVHSRR